MSGKLLAEPLTFLLARRLRLLALAGGFAPCTPTKNFFGKKFLDFKKL